MTTIEEREVIRGNSKKNRFNMDLRRHFFTERIINIWNSLDHQTVLAFSVNNFKWNLDRLRLSGKMGMLLDWCLKTLGAYPALLGSPVRWVIRWVSILFSVNSLHRFSCLKWTPPSRGVDVLHVYPTEEDHARTGWTTSIPVHGQVSLPVDSIRSFSIYLWLWEWQKNRHKWRKYVYGVANPRIEDG